ncbi:MAG: DUF4142 domain-containing protein [Cyclobacteriaceae bacterium]|nr:DUF4142 domain-containing protein [Cyclobacteriaceae bacterium]
MMIKKISLTVLMIALLCITAMGQTDTTSKDSYQKNQNDQLHKDQKMHGDHKMHKKHEGHSQSSDSMSFSAEEFIRDVAKGGMLEVKLGELALEKEDVSQEVRDLGHMIVQNHANANQQLKDIAGNIQAEFPDELDQEQQQKVEKFQEMSGEEFGQEYVDLMIEDHKEDISKFEQAKSKVENNELQSWIDTTLPVLKQHLQLAQNIQEHINNEDSGIRY